MLYIKKENTLTDTYSLLLSKVMTELYMEGVRGRIRALFRIKKTIFFVVHAKPDVRLWLEQATGGFLCCAAGLLLCLAASRPSLRVADCCDSVQPYLARQANDRTHTHLCMYKNAFVGQTGRFLHPLVSQRRSTTADWADTVFQTSLLHELLRYNTHLATKSTKFELGKLAARVWTEQLYNYEISFEW